MSFAHILVMSCCLALAIGFIRPAHADLYPVEKKIWKPLADETYLQEIGTQIRTQAPVKAIAILNNTPYAVMNDKLHLIRETALEPIADAPDGIVRVRSLQGALWIVAQSGVFRFDGRVWTKVGGERFVDFCTHLGTLYAATKDDLYRLENGAFVNAAPEGGYYSNDTTVIMEDGTQILADPVRIGPIQEITSYSGTLYLLRPNGLALIAGKTLIDKPFDWGALPSPQTHDMLSLGSQLFIATDQGVGVLRGMAMSALRGADGLPYEDTTCLAEGFDGDLWIGTARGAIRKLEHEYHYFGLGNWLPGDRVNDIRAMGHTVYIATDGGVGIIRYEPYTLQKKAAFYERELETWGHKRLGFVHAISWNGQEWIRHITDNDGGQAAHYLAAMSFKYAVTGNEQDRQQALDTFKAMVWLDDITPSPGFIARAIWSVKGDKGERENRGSGGLPAKWYATDDGLWMWKGDTSSDEVDAHMYAVTIFRELAAKDAEKDRANRHIANIAGHILTNGWVLRDMDGKPTRWGRWDPDYLLRPYGMESRGLNGMQAQTYMRTAFALTQDPRFEEGFQQLLKWGYPAYTVRQKITFPPESIATWDDELAFRCYYTLLRYTTDPAMRSIYLRSLERTWEVKRVENVAWYNYIYGAITGNDCEEKEAATYLREWPMDLANRGFHNSHRADLAPKRGYGAYVNTARALSPRETTAQTGSCSTLQYDSNASGNTITPPISWLEQYWMGRYHGFIKAPTATDPALTSVPPGSGNKSGALPYDGTPRPEIPMTPQTK